MTTVSFLQTRSDRLTESMLQAARNAHGALSDLAAITVGVLMLLALTGGVLILWWLLRGGLARSRRRFNSIDYL